MTPVPDVIDRNGCMYPREVLDKAITEWFERGSTFITINQPSTPLGGCIDMREVCAEAQSIDLKSYRMTIRIMNTPTGKILQDIIESEVDEGCRVGSGISDVAP